jgi:hypothetical protein
MFMRPLYGAKEDSTIKGAPLAAECTMMAAKTSATEYLKWWR